MAAVVFAMFRRPAIALGVVMCTYGLEQWAQANSSFFLVHQTLTNYITACLLLLALIISVLKAKPILAHYPPAGWLTIALFMYALLSMVWSIHIQGTQEQWNKHWPYIITVVGLSPLIITHPRDAYDGLLATLTLGSIILLLLLLTTQIEGRKVIFSAGQATIGAKGGNPLATASLAGYVALAVVLMNFQGLAKFWQWARWFIVALAMVIIIKSGSRGQLIGLLIALLVFLPVSRRFKSYKGFAGVVISLSLLAGLAMWGLSFFAESDRWAVQNMLDVYSGTRISYILRVLDYWINSSPIYWFAGLGNSASFAPYLIETYPHMVMAEVLAEEGLIGFGLLSAIIFLATRSIIRIYPYTAPFPDARGVLAVLGAWFLFVFTLSFKQGSMLGNTYLFAFAIMLGRLEQVVRRHHESTESAAQSLPA